MKLETYLPVKLARVIRFIVFLFSLAGILVGLSLLIQPQEASIFLIRIIGVFLMLSGIADVLKIKKM